MYGYYGYDTLFLAVIVVFILGIWAQIRVKNKKERSWFLSAATV